MELPDGTVIPSYMGVSTPGSQPTTNQNMGLCIGEVKEIIYPKSDKSVSKKFIEYRVIVQYVDAMGRPGTTEFGNCFTTSLFGGVADKCRFTYRKQKKANESGLGEGSKVVILCINGNSNNAIIIGGLRDGQRDKNEDPGEDEGHHLRWEFNGMLMTIDKEGVFTLFRRGPTDEDGHLDKDHDSDQSGAFFEMDQDGNIEMVDAGDGNNTIKIDHKNDKIEMKADSGTIHTKSKNDTTIESESGRIVLKSVDGVSLGDANAKEPLVLGKTQRKGVKQMHSSMKSAIQTAQQSIDQAGTQIMQAAGLILPLTALPAKPGLIAAGLALSSAAQALSQLAQAIEQYESNADQELSQDHFLNN